MPIPIRKLIAIGIVLCFFLPLGGCYDATEIDEEVYALVIGVDKGVNNMVRITFQYATYKDGGGGKAGGGGSDGGGSEESGEVDGTIVSTVEASSLLGAINLLDAAVNRQISLMHAKMLVFSEEYAREGIARYVEPLARFREVREFMRVVVCKGKAEDFIMENKTFIGTNSAKNIELMFEQSKNSGYFPDVFFNDFYIALLAPYGQSCAIYAGVNDFQHFPQDTGGKNPPLNTKQDMEPGDIPRKGGTKNELFGTVVFDGDKMVGSLTPDETRFFLMGIGEFRRGFFVLEDPEKPGFIFVIEAELSKSPKMKGNMEGGRPVLDLELTLDADIVSIQSRNSYENLDHIKGLEKIIEDYFTTGLTKTIERTQQEWNSDIFHFGKKIAGEFQTIQEFEQYNWLSHYKEAKISTQVNVNLRRSGYIYEAKPIRGTSEGGQGST
ncbi:MAG: Ger(x)C family spore germination protein [Peptococcaceae bacterium]|nr:Ger(x)C family spore germination protein [Peptococcaceae bacterium]